MASAAQHRDSILNQSQRQRQHASTI